jgi:beta-phosphoglucomutase-like phosphatase (HAD superfamily)
MALATSAPKANVVHTLAERDRSGAFPVIVRGDEVARGKPAPDVFIEAARRLAWPPPIVSSSKMHRWASKRRKPPACRWSH